MITRRNFLKKMIIGGGALLTASYPTVIERFAIQTNHYQIPVRNLPDAFTGFTIIHLSDLHHGGFMPMRIYEEIVTKVNQMECDIIVNTGDNVCLQRNEQIVNEIWQLLIELKAPLGVYSVLGNNDHFVNRTKSLEWLEKSGQSIRHRSVAFEKDGSRIWLGGAGDLWNDTDGVDIAFTGVPNEDCKILLAHNPDTADLEFSERIDLVLSGHTHGGQVVLPFIGPPLLPVHNKNYSSGFIRTPHTNLFISRGIGTSVPIRFNCYPEIAVLTLTPEV